METWIPLSIIACMLFAMLVIGKLAQRKVKNSDDYVVANRSTPLFLLIGTLFASFWGGGAVIGGSGAAYTDGVYGVIADPFAAGLSLILIGVFFVTILRNSKFKSLGELYRRRYGANISYLASGLMIPTYLIWTAVQLLAISKVINVLFGIPTAVVTIVAALIVIFFTYLGGMLAVIWTDSVQMIIILIGLCLILVFGVNYIGGMESLVTYTPDNFWNFLPQEQNATSWLVYLSMWVGMGLGNIPSPDLAQRAFVAKDAKTAKRGFVLSGLLYWVAGLIPILIALIGIAMVEQGLLDPAALAVDSELLIPMMSKLLFNPYLQGIFIGSLVCAVLSSASTALFTTAVLLSNDVIQPLSKHRHVRLDEMQTSKWCIIIVGIGSVIVALTTTQLYDLMIFAFSLLFGMLFFPFVFALKSKRANKYGIGAGMLVGLGINVLGCVTQQTMLPQPEYLFTLLPALANLITIVVVSKLTQLQSQAMPVTWSIEKGNS